MHNDMSSDLPQNIAPRCSCCCQATGGRPSCRHKWLGCTVHTCWRRDSACDTSREDGFDLVHFYGCLAFDNPILHNKSAWVLRCCRAALWESRLLARLQGRKLQDLDIYNGISLRPRTTAPTSMYHKGHQESCQTRRCGRFTT
jgi:hypothetical protein